MPVLSCLNIKHKVKIIAVIGLIAIGFWAFFTKIPLLTPENTEVTITIDSNNKFTLPCPSCFKFWLRISNQDKKMQVGQYRPTTNITYAELSNMIRAGAGKYSIITIKAGDVAANINSAFLKADITHTNLLLEDNHLFLLPMTIRYNAGCLDQDLLSYFAQASFQRTQVIAQDCPDKYADKFFIVASIITKESAYTPEYPYIAAVIYNRLRLNMPLQVDVYPKSYARSGLPRVAIASPNEQALIAACHPAIVNDWLYYVAGNDGRHIFSPTYTAHKDVNIRRYHVHNH